MGILSWFSRKGNSNGSKQEEPAPATKSDDKAVSEVPGMNGAIEVRKPDQLLADISVFEFGSVAASADMVTLAGFCPVSDELEPCRWEILPATGTEAVAIIADFMLVWLPDPTVSLRRPLSVNAGCLSEFFYACPDNAFQVAFAEKWRKLFVVGTGASLIGTGLTVLLTAVRIAIDVSFDDETNYLPILSTSVVYGGLHGSFK